MSKVREVQEVVFDYFDQTPIELYIKFVDSFVFFQPQTDKAVSDLCEKFITDQGIIDAFLNYRYDIDHPEKMFRKSSGSEVEIINLISQALLALSHNKLRGYVGEHSGK